MPKHPTPLLSVVIPTHKRPEFLPRAIHSTLESAPDGDVEVLVIPNGTDQSWRASAERLRNERRVKWHPIRIGHANVARNHGLSLATGKYVRFLDDDDYLLNPAALEQLEEAERHNVDAISGEILSLHERSGRQIVLRQPETNDFVSAVLCSGRTTSVHAHIFSRQSLQGFTWPESLSIRQDTDFLIRYAAKERLRWRRFGKPVGVWVHHDTARVSRGKDPGKLGLRHTAQLILDAVGTLRDRNELSEERRRAAADGLWSAAQKGLLYEWRFWLHAISIARELDPNSTPPSRIYRIGKRLGVPPLCICVALLPPRFALKAYRARSSAPATVQHVK